MQSLNNISPNIGLNGITLEDAKRMLKGYRFFFKVPLIATMTEEEIEFLGVPVDVNQYGEIEYIANTRMSDVYYDLYRILEIYRDGHPIKLTNRNDLPKILEVLSNVANALEGGVVNINNEFIELIDDFIQEVLNYNRTSIEYKIKQQQEEDLKETGLVSGIEIEGYDPSSKVTYQSLDGIKVDKW